MAALKSVAIAGVSLAVLGVGGYFADNAVRDNVEARVVSSLQAALHPSGTPEVELGGTPFSLALLTRTVPDAQLAVAGLPVEMAGHPVTLADVSVTAQQLTLTDAQLVLGSATGEARLSYDDLSAVASVPIQYGGSDRLQASYSVSVFAQEFTASVSAVPELDVAAQHLRLAQAKLTVAGVDLDAEALQTLIDAVVQPVDVALPYGVRLTAITPTPQGLQLAAAGEQLVIPLG